MELIPRITRAQAMDALSSQANIAGYKAAIMAAEALPKIFPMLMTAAGTLQAARVFVIGAGVAGLQAISTARRLGAVVSGFDVRAAVKEQVQSVGAKFIELPLETGDLQDKGGYAKTLTPEQQRKQMELLGQAWSSKAMPSSPPPPSPASPPLGSSPPQQSKRCNEEASLSIWPPNAAATANSPCRAKLSSNTVSPSSVIPISPHATVPLHSSNMYANNLVKLLALLVNKEGALTIDAADEVIAGCLVTHRGIVVHPRVKELLAAVEPARTAEGVRV